MSGRARATVLLCLCAGLLTAGRVRVPFARSLFFSGEVEELPAARDCERCHQEVYREWERSLHATAWRSEAFRRASAETRAEECVGCHAPAPFRASDAPAVRDAHRDEGVTCVSCHLSPASGDAHLTMRGPVSRSSPVEVHPVIEGDRTYRSSELCGTCHRASFAEWSLAPAPAAEEKETCQGCHMPAVRRTVESVHDEHAYSSLLVALEREEDLRRHAFAVPEPDRERVALVARVAGAGSRIEAEVENRLPHALPTGQFGRRQLAIAVTWPGGERRETVVRSRSDAIPTGGSRSIAVELPPEARGKPVTVALLRYDHATGGWSEIAHAVPSP
jgi:nitrate/TMAO reductase-like tetraheme cytochrome c subunit